MDEAPDYDSFLADPAGVWQRARGAIPHEWAVQAARSSRDFRETLKTELALSLAQHGSLEPSAERCAILAQVSDAQDIAELFGRLARVRPPVEWAADFAKRMAK